MNEPLIGDALSWTLFHRNTLNEESYPPQKIELFNRLIAHTNNFFSISAYGAFTPGYVMIISKELLPSFSSVDDKILDELFWFIKVTKKSIKEAYKRKILEFEHGMCACVGGLDRAHLHLMTVNEKSTDDLIKKSINKTLLKRKAGITSVEIAGNKLENIHDILEVMNSKNSSSFKINGKQLHYEDIFKDLDIKNWPIAARSHVLKGGHYVYFKTESMDSSFFTKNNFQTQLGRQIVYETEKETNASFNDLVEGILKQNPYAELWRWQNYAFKENMLKTMRDLHPFMKKIQDENSNNKFNFTTFKKEK
tara:strand:- start:233 stop:1156 length:924 start_codon:yes stop_codon:yes gene_type:complete